MKPAARWPFAGPGSPLRSKLAVWIVAAVLAWALLGLIAWAVVALVAWALS